MKTISLGGLHVSRVGLEVMSLSAFYTGAGSDDAESVRATHRILALNQRHEKEPAEGRKPRPKEPP